MLVMTVLAVAGCADRREQNLAACKIEAIEANKPAHVFDDKAAAYLRACMEAAGYLLRDACIARETVWDRLLSPAPLECLSGDVSTVSCALLPLCFALAAGPLRRLSASLPMS
jgi:hypothetical protein